MTYGLKEIAKDLLAGKLQMTDAELSEERLKVCRQCPELQPALMKCSLCGCYLLLKTKLLDAACPASLW